MIDSDDEEANDFFNLDDFDMDAKEVAKEAATRKGKMTTDKEEEIIMVDSEDDDDVIEMEWSDVEEDLNFVNLEVVIEDSDGE
jgi:hypothetical protein